MRGLCGPARLRRVVLERWVRLWSAARLAEALPGGLHASNVVLGPVELHGTRQVRIGRGCLLYPDIYLETQGDGRIEIGDGVVLSRGVHIVAFDEVRLGDGVMVGEYSSVRDADHRRGPDGPRHSGHLARSVYLMDHAWVGRGASILKGVQVGQHGVVAANAVVTHDVQSHGVVAGIPARPLGCERPLPSYGM